MVQIYSGFTVYPFSLYPLGIYTNWKLAFLIDLLVFLVLYTMSFYIVKIQIGIERYTQLIPQVTTHMKGQKKWNNVLECFIASSRLDIDVFTSVQTSSFHIFLVLGY